MYRLHATEKKKFSEQNFGLQTKIYGEFLSLNEKYVTAKHHKFLPETGVVDSEAIGTVVSEGDPRGLVPATTSAVT